MSEAMCEEDRLALAAAMREAVDSNVIVFLRAQGMVPLAPQQFGLGPAEWHGRLQQVDERTYTVAVGVSDGKDVTTLPRTGLISDVLGFSEVSRVVAPRPRLHLA